MLLCVVWALKMNSDYILNSSYFACGRAAEIRSLREGAVWWVAPPCNTWVFLSRSTTGRSLTRPKGAFMFPLSPSAFTRSKDVSEDKAGEQIHPADVLSASWCRLLPVLFHCCARCEFAWRKNIHYVIEQPSSSILWSYWPLQVWGLVSALCSVQAMLKRHRAFTVQLPLGAYGASSMNLGCFEAFRLVVEETPHPLHNLRRDERARHCIGP